MENFELIRMLGKGGERIFMRKAWWPSSVRQSVPRAQGWWCRPGPGLRDESSAQGSRHAEAENTRAHDRRAAGARTHQEQSVSGQSAVRIPDGCEATSGDGHVSSIWCRKYPDYIRGGELFTHLCARGSFDLATTRYYIAELTIALEHIHSKGIFYRDLKLENVMIDAEGHLTLTDFGLSKEFDGGELRQANSYCGTIEYMAPEVVQRTENGYTEVDCDFFIKVEFRRSTGGRWACLRSNC